MMPMLMANAGDRVTVSKVSGNEAIKQRLGELGFVVGAEVEVLQQQSGDMIVKIMDSKLALTKEMTSKIMVDLN